MVHQTPLPPEQSGSGIGQYFEKRRKIFPRRVTGYFRRIKWIVMFLTLGFYYLAPFMRWDRGPNAPDQAILIDLQHARAYWFFIEIWPQEVYYLTAILIFAAVGLFYVTSLFGRVWCGYFCPQTVWTDLFIKVEDWVQGDRGARQRLDQAPWTFEKIWKKTVTHILWLLIGLCTGGAFVFYFNDAPTLWHDMITGNMPTVPLLFIIGLTFSTYLMAGFSREQVCTYMCPYARFQSAMFDRDTLVIGYDTNRGEARGHFKKGDDFNTRGHCIDCSACVQVCPMGIDIRDGLQIDCIACGLCIDACDNVMDKLSLPRGLIRYSSSKHLNEPQKPLDLWAVFLRPRSLYYMAVLSVVAIIVLYSLITRPKFDMHVIHDRNPLMVQLSDGTIRNGYDIRILNKTYEDQVFEISVSDIPVTKISLRSDSSVQPVRVRVGPAGVGTDHLFVEADPKDMRQQDMDIIFKNMVTGDMIKVRTMFVYQGTR